MKPIPGLTEADWALADTLKGFTQKYLLNRYDTPKPIPEVHREWWALFLSNYKQVAIAAPRGFAKSTALTFAYSLFLIVFKISRHLLLIGSNEANAAAFLQEMKTEFLENEDLIAYSGFARFKKETETEMVLEFNDGRRVRVIAKGAQQRMRGMKWERRRPDTVLFDDMEDEEMVLNEARRKKFRDWFLGTVRPIIADGGRIRGVGTIIGFDSFLERTMPKETSENTINEPLRDYRKESIPGQWMSVKYRAHGPTYEHLLWPERFSETVLKEIRREYFEMGMLDIYGQEYLNNPIDETTAYFRRSDFLPMTEEDHKKNKTFYAAADFAIGESDRSAFTAIVVGGMDSDGVLHIVDVRRGRWDGKEIIDEMFSVQLAWEPELFRVESENIAKSLGAFLFDEMGKNGNPYINIDDRPPTKDKDKRGRSMQARTRARRVKFDKEADWYEDFEDENLKYPKHAYKDQFDAFAWLGLMLDEMVSPLTEEEEEEMEYQESFFKSMPQGRCEATGY